MTSVKRKVCDADSDASNCCFQMTAATSTPVGVVLRHTRRGDHDADGADEGGTLRSPCGGEDRGGMCASGSSDQYRRVSSYSKTHAPSRGSTCLPSLASMFGFLRWSRPIDRSRVGTASRAEVMSALLLRLHSLTHCDCGLQSSDKVIPVNVLPTPHGMDMSVDGQLSASSFGSNHSSGGPTPRRSMQSPPASVVNKAGGRAVTTLAPKRVTVGVLNGVGDASCRQTKVQSGESGTSGASHDLHVS